MPKLKSIIIIHTTEQNAEGRSSAGFELVIAKQASDLHKDFPMRLQSVNLAALANVSESDPNVNWEPGQTNEYEFNVSKDNVDSDAPGFDISIKMRHGSDGWLPRSLYVIGVPVKGRCFLLGCHPKWTDGWFDVDQPGAKREHVVSNYARRYVAFPPGNLPPEPPELLPFTH